MYTTIGPNKYQFYGKIVVLLVLIPAGILILRGLRSPKMQHIPLVPAIFLSLISILCTVLLVLMILELFFLAKEATIDHGSKTLTLAYLVMGDKLLTVKAISHYYTTTIASKSDVYKCILIEMKSGQRHLLGDFNLKDCQPLQTFLDGCGISNKGHLKISMFAYFQQNFRTRRQA